jgi:hypothetical protein
MTPEVLILLAKLREPLADLPRIGLLSPSKEERALFPRATVLTRKDWDLDERRPDLRFDVIIACNVFHYSPDPTRWFNSVTASCRAFLCTDLIRRKRSLEGELGHDGDCMRYAIGGEEPVIGPRFDLNLLDHPLLGYLTFAGAANEYGDARHFLALVRGQLDGPLIRLDNYPSHLRTDASAEQAIIRHFEDHALSIHLGISSARLSRPSLQFLQRLKHLEPAVQGVEARWQWRSTLERTLIRAKNELERELGRLVRTYIPSLGRLDRFTARTLGRLGFELCLAESSIPGPYLRTKRSDFAGPSTAWPGSAEVEVVTLELSTEADLLRSGGSRSLSQLIQAIDRGRSAKQRAITSLARLVALK